MKTSGSAYSPRTHEDQRDRSVRACCFVQSVAILLLFLNNFSALSRNGTQCDITPRVKSQRVNLEYIQDQRKAQKRTLARDWKNLMSKN